MDLHRMDYRSSVAQGSTLSQVNADALLLVLTPEQGQTGDPVLDALIQDAIEAGDLALKSGRALYLHRPRGVQAARLVLAVAAEGAQASRCGRVPVSGCDGVV